MTHHFYFSLQADFSLNLQVAFRHILIVDDDERLRELLYQYLQEQGFMVTQAQNTQEALEFMENLKFDLIILDVMMPGQNGFDFCTHLRAQKEMTPILFLSARGEIGDRLEGFGRGGDDFLPKPFEPKELLFRIHAILKRSTKHEENASLEGDQKLHFGEFTFDLSNSRLTKKTEIIPLTEVERKILARLLLTPKIYHSRESLAQEVSIGASARSIDVQVVRLRRKIEKDPKFPRYLQTMRHKGYVFIP